MLLFGLDEPVLAPIFGVTCAELSVPKALQHKEQIIFERDRITAQNTNLHGFFMWAVT